MTKSDKEFINAITDAIENDDYDTLDEKYGDEWNIIEGLLAVIDQLVKSK